MNWTAGSTPEFMFMQFFKAIYYPQNNGTWLIPQKEYLISDIDFLKNSSNDILFIAQQYKNKINNFISNCFFLFGTSNGKW